ncbi:MAG: hydroxyacid dehydrogenase [Rhizobiaceae bacterium]|nr:hydroxyacid dehydrogenase [Rhizobiaceae bacterium]
MRPTIYSTHKLHPRAEEILRGKGNLVVASSLKDDVLIEEGRKADVIIVRAPLPPSLFSDAPRLRAAIRHGAGIDMIPYEEATRAGVLIANVPGSNSQTVAEHVMMVSMMLLRRFRMVDSDLRGKGWLTAREHSNDGHDISGKTIGIVGFGNIGAAIARIARHGFGMNVLAHNRSQKEADGVEFLELEALLSRSDITVLCCPLTAETRGLIDARRIALMKPGSFLINVSRGPVVVDDALIAALQSGHVGGAALDVFAEQPLAPTHPYFGFANVIITPHMAGITDESMMRMGIGAAQEALRVLAGDLPANLRNPEAIELYRKRYPA